MKNWIVRDGNKALGVPDLGSLGQHVFDFVPFLLADQIMVYGKNVDDIPVIFFCSRLKQ